MKTSYSYLLLFFLSFFLFSDGYSQICNYGYRKRITIDPTKVMGPSDFTNFNVMIKITGDADLKTTANSGHVQSSNGYDITFTAADGYTVLSYQREYYNGAAGTGDLTVYVQVPTLYTSLKTVLYMYYGMAGATDLSTNNIWSAGYYAVWHLQNNNFNSDGATSYTGTNNGTANQQPAYINDGRDCSGDWIEVQNTFPNITTNFTISGWAYTTDRTQAGQRIFCDDVNNTGGYAMSIGDPGSGAIRFYSRSSNPVSLDTPNNTISNNTWYYFVAVADITNLTKKIYVNGVQQASGTYTNAWGTDNGNASLAGETASGETGNRLAGRIDEVRIASSALSVDYIQTDYNNQSSPSTFYSISVEGKRWTGGTSTVWSTGSNWVGGSAPAVGDDVVITNGTNQPTLDITRAFKSLWVQSSATLSLSSFTFSDSLDITNCGTITGNTSTVSFIGPAAYYSNYCSGSGTYNLSSLTVNSATNQGLTLNKDVNVDGTLTLTAGLVRTTTTNILALSANASSTSGSNSSFVCGPMSKAGTTAFSFPVGKGSTWRRIGTGVPTSSTTYRAEYFNASYSPLTPVVSPLHHVSSLEYWQLDRTVGTGNATVTLNWEDATAQGINQISQLRVASWSGTQWQDQGQGSFTGGVGVGVAGSITSNGNVSNFTRPFTFGAISGWANNPLPVKLLSFTAVKDGNYVKLDWATASEVNNDYFTVQKTQDGENFVDVMKVDGHGNSTNTVTYREYDKAPYEGQSYYRLGQTDLDGTTTFTNLQPVIFTKDAGGSFDLTLYPNPVTQGQDIQLNFASADNKSVLVVVMDMLGQEYFSKVLILENGKTTIAIDPENNLAAGTYIVKVSGENDLYVKKLIVR